MAGLANLNCMVSISASLVNKRSKEGWYGTWCAYGLTRIVAADTIAALAFGTVHGLIGALDERFKGFPRPVGGDTTTDRNPDGL